jgi:hypothetical protein
MFNFHLTSFPGKMQESWQERARGAKIGLDEKPEIPRFFQKRDGTICHADPAFSSQGRYDHFDTCPYSNCKCFAIIRETSGKIKANYFGS